MILKSIASILAIVTALSTSAVAGENSTYIGAKTGSLSMDTTVFGLDDGPNGSTLVLAYDDVSLLGLEIYSINRYETMLMGFGVDVMFNEGEFLNGGMVDIDFKLGAYYKDLSAYALVGYGIQSLSSYTLAHGMYYGAALNYDAFEHLAVKVEYRMHNLTALEEGIVLEQEYKLSGVMASLCFRY